MASNQQLQDMLTALRQVLDDTTRELMTVKAEVVEARRQEVYLHAKTQTGWDALDERIHTLEADAADAGIDARTERPKKDRWWDLEHKGTLKEFSRDTKGYTAWAKKVKAFCKSKQHGFRKVLNWAEKSEVPIGQELMKAVQWEHIDEVPLMQRVSPPEARSDSSAGAAEPQAWRNHNNMSVLFSFFSHGSLLFTQISNTSARNPPESSGETHQNSAHNRRFAIP